MKLVHLVELRNAILKQTCEGWPLAPCGYHAQLAADLAEALEEQFDIYHIIDISEQP